VGGGLLPNWQINVPLGSVPTMELTTLTMRAFSCRTQCNGPCLARQCLQLRGPAYPMDLVLVFCSLPCITVVLILWFYCDMRTNGAYPVVSSLPLHTTRSCGVVFLHLHPNCGCPWFSFALHTTGACFFLKVTGGGPHPPPAGHTQTAGQSLVLVQSFYPWPASW
jgi:hypothetical protein